MRRPLVHRGGDGVRGGPPRRRPPARRRCPVKSGLIVASALLALGCARRQPGEPAADLHTAFAYGVDSLDPHLDNSLEGFEQVSNVYEPLVGTDRLMRLVPTLAVSWSNPDSTTWSFRLRTGVSFHDGSPLTPEDVVYSLTRLRTDETLAIRSYLAEVTGATVENGQVVLRTGRPSARLLYDLTRVLIVRAGSTRAGLEAQPNGTGPYAVESWTKGRSMRLRRHEGYWGSKPAHARVHVDMSVVEQGLVALLEGGLPVVLRTRLAGAESAASRVSRYRLVRQPSLYLFLLGLNVASPTLPGTGVANPFRHLDVRRAIHLALDRGRVAAAASPYAIPTSHIVPSSVFGSDPSAPATSRDIEEARRLLDRAGYRNGFDVGLHAVSAPSLPHAAELKAQLAEIGIRITLVGGSSTPDFYEGLRRQQFGLWLVGEGSETGEAGGLLARSFHSPDPVRQLGTDNFGGYASRDLDRAIEEADAILDPRKRLPLLQRAVRLAEDELWWIPLYHGQSLFIVDRRLLFEPRQDLLLRYAEIGRPQP